MTTHLQTVLDAIEADAAARSRNACAAVETLEAAYTLRDRLRAAGADVNVADHLWDSPARFTLYARRGEGGSLRRACAQLGIDLPPASGLHDVQPHIMIDLETDAARAAA